MPVAVAPGSMAAALAQLPEALAQDVRDALQDSRAKATLKAYAADWKVWAAWCEAEGQTPFPATPEALAAFLVRQSKGEGGKKYATLRRYRGTLSRAHTLAGIKPNPAHDDLVKMTMAGIRRRKGTTQEQKAPLTRELLAQLVGAVKGDDLRAKRDRALLLLGFAGAFRASELVSLTLADLDWSHKGGLLVHLRKSKTDQEGHGKVKPIAFVDGPLCAARAVRAWTEALGRDSGALFVGIDQWGNPRSNALHPETVTDLVRTFAMNAGLDPDRVASHSLRAGFVTQGFFDGVSPRLLQAMTGHATLDMLNRYDRRGQVDPFAGAAPALTGGPIKKEQT